MLLLPICLLLILLLLLVMLLFVRGGVLATFVSVFGILGLPSFFAFFDRVHELQRFLFALWVIEVQCYASLQWVCEGKV